MLYDACMHDECLMMHAYTWNFMATVEFYEY